MATDTNDHTDRTVSEQAEARLNGEVPVCRRCGGDVNADALACPNCGFDPVSQHRGRMRFWGVITGLLCITVVGLPIALLTGYAALRHRREIKRGVAE